MLPLELFPRVAVQLVRPPPPRFRLYTSARPSETPSPKAPSGPQGTSPCPFTQADWYVETTGDPLVRAAPPWLQCVPHRPRETGLAHPADTSRTNLAAALARPSRWHTHIRTRNAEGWCGASSSSNYLSSSSQRGRTLKVSTVELKHIVWSLT